MDVYVEETQIDLRIATYVQTGHVEKKRRRKRVAFNRWNWRWNL